MALPAAQVQSYLDVATTAAKAAGAVMRAAFYQPKQVTHKGAVDLVTETDQQCEELILSHIREAFPSHQFIGEETSAAVRARWRRLRLGWARGRAAGRIHCAWHAIFMWGPWSPAAPQNLWQAPPCSGSSCGLIHNF